MVLPDCRIRTAVRYAIDRTGLQACLGQSWASHQAQVDVHARRSQARNKSQLACLASHCSSPSDLAAAGLNWTELPQPPSIPCPNPSIRWCHYLANAAGEAIGTTSLPSTVVLLGNSSSELCGRQGSFLQIEACNRSLPRRATAEAPSSPEKKLAEQFAEQQSRGASQLTRA